MEKQPVDGEQEVDGKRGYVEGVEGGGVAPGNLFGGFLEVG